MKEKLFFCSILAAGMSLMSCSKEADLPIEPQETEIETLEFASVDEMERTILSLMSMTGEQREAWYAEAGDFTSQDAFKWEVVDELDAARSMEEVRAIQAQHAGKLLFNMNEADEDISPYIPSSKHGYSLVLNSDGDVKIAGVVKNFNDLTSYEQTRFAAVTRAMPTGLNSVSIQVGDRKAFATAFRASTGTPTMPGNESWVNIELDAHKKGLFGWNNYRTAYCLQCVWYSPSTWTTIAPTLSGQPFWTPEVPAGTIEKIGTTPQRRSGWVPGQMDLNIYTRGTGVAGMMQLRVRI